MDTKALIARLRLYAREYRTMPYGREVEGTDELLDDAAGKLKSLAAYEATGLEPCDYAAMRAALEQADRARQALNDLLHIVGAAGIDYLRELVEAEKDGRLVALPCKIGDTVYRVAKKKKYLNNPKNTMYLKEIVIKPENIHKYITEIGKTVFITRPEAEAVLEAQKGSSN